MRDDLPTEFLMVREALERVLEPQLCAKIVFAALDRFGQVPVNKAEVAALVRGPLAEAIANHVDPERQQAVHQALSHAQRPKGSAGSDFDVDVDVDVEHAGFGLATAVAPLSGYNPVPVLVVAGSRRFGDQVLASLGPGRVKPAYALDETSLRHATFATAPLLVIIDASDPPRGAVQPLAAALRSLPQHMTTIVWACETPYGEVLVRALQALAVSPVLLSRHEGLEPLFDLVLSRYLARDSSS